MPGGFQNGVGDQMMAGTAASTAVIAGAPALSIAEVHAGGRNATSERALMEMT